MHNKNKYKNKRKIHHNRITADTPEQPPGEEKYYLMSDRTAKFSIQILIGEFGCFCLSHFDELNHIRPPPLSLDFFTTKNLTEERI